MVRLNKSLLVLTCVLGSVRTAASAELVSLARNGRALMPVVVASDASAMVRQSAEDLAAYLSRADATFAVSTDLKTSGIAVGLPAHFPASPFGQEWFDPRIAEREDDALRTHAGGVWLVGATDKAVRKFSKSPELDSVSMDSTRSIVATGSSGAGPAAVNRHRDRQRHPVVKRNLMPSS